MSSVAPHFAPSPAADIVSRVSADGGTDAGRGGLLVISAPSGTGKSTLCGRLVGTIPGFALSISHTTRAPRGTERNGVDYFFVTAPRFAELVERDFFLEHATVFGERRYGTSRLAVELIQATGHHAVLDIDVQGAAAIKTRCPEAKLILLLPPSFAELVRRLTGRGTDTPAEVTKRLAFARGELEYAPHFDYAVVNDDVEAALARLRAIAHDEPAADACRMTTMMSVVERLRNEAEAWSGGAPLPPAALPPGATVELGPLLRGES